MLIVSNYHLEIKVLSRGKGHSFARTANYISGVKLHDNYLDTTYYHHRSDVAWAAVSIPSKAPRDFLNLQTLCNKIEEAERRYDARTAREFIGSLPNELSLEEQEWIVEKFVTHNLVRYGLCAVAARHTGENRSAPERNNPHTHILVSTRTAGPDGFSKTKDREHDRKEFIPIWREQWADIQNRAYERNGLDIRVSHESLEVQGKRNCEPTIHLSLPDWQRERRGIRTSAGDRKRAIAERNAQRVLDRELAWERSMDLELSR